MTRGNGDWMWKRQQPHSGFSNDLCLSCFGGIFTRGHIKILWDEMETNKRFFHLNGHRESLNLNLSRWIFHDIFFIFFVERWMKWRETRGEAEHVIKRQSNGRADWQVAIKCAIQRWCEMRRSLEYGSNTCPSGWAHCIGWLDFSMIFLEHISFFLFWGYGMKRYRNDV